jgi:adenylate cyclase
MISGSILLTYIALHMLNHMLGIWSLAAAESGLRLAMALWTSWPGTIALYGAALVHIALALHTIYARRHWRLPAIEWLRLWAGFSMPAMLIGHVLGTRIASSYYAYHVSYAVIVESLVASGREGLQLSLLAPGWLHGCLGLWFTLRRFALLRRARWLLVGLMLAAPVLSAYGFMRMRADVMALRAQTQTPAPRIDDAATIARREALETQRERALWLYLFLIALAAGAGLVRNWRSPAAH